MMAKLKHPDGAKQLKDAPLSPYPTGIKTPPQQGAQPGQEEMEQGLNMLKGLFNE